MSKRDAFYEAHLSNEGLSWPVDSGERTELAARLIGARLIGATESVLQDVTGIASGQPPEPEDTSFAEKKRKAELLATLSDEQRSVVHDLLKETATRVLYWSLVHLDTLPGAALEVRVVPILEDDTELAPCDVTESLALHERYHTWVAEFAELID